MSKKILPDLNRRSFAPAPISSLRQAFRELDRICAENNGATYSFRRENDLLANIENAIEEWPKNLSGALRKDNQLVDKLILTEEEQKRENRSFRKPRLELTAEVTIKDNLSIKWQPTPAIQLSIDENEKFQFKNNSDFIDYVHNYGNQMYFSHRPLCEIAFIKDIDAVTHMLDKDSNAYAPILAGYILDTITQLYHLIYKFMQDHFSVTKKHEFEYFTSDRGEVSWRIYDVQNRKTEQDAEWLSEFKASYGITIKTFLEKHLRDNANQKFISIGEVETRRDANQILNRLQELPESNRLIESLQKRIDREKGKHEEKTKKQRALRLKKRVREDWTVVGKQELETLIWTYPVTKIAEMFGLSDNAIGKKCKKFGIEKPKRGFWNKVEAGNIPHPNGKPV